MKLGVTMSTLGSCEESLDSGDLVSGIDFPSPRFVGGDQYTETVDRRSTLATLGPKAYQSDCCGFSPVKHISIRACTLLAAGRAMLEDVPSNMGQGFRTFTFIC